MKQKTNKGGYKMAIIRWDPYRDLVSLRQRMDKLFDDFFTEREEGKEIILGTWSPKVDIHEKENALVLTAEIPGIEEKDIEISIEGNTLILKGKREVEKEIKKEDFHRFERSYGSFCRSFTLPNYVDQDKIKAEHDKGLLKISMPKKPELKPKKVKILKPKKAKEEKSQS
jgi:HSP20 family protein